MHSNTSQLNLFLQRSIASAAVNQRRNSLTTHGDWGGMHGIALETPWRWATVRVTQKLRAVRRWMGLAAHGNMRLVARQQGPVRSASFGLPCNLLSLSFSP